jgi:hypothetical protein
MRELTYLQILALRSPLPVANNSPVGLGATEMTAKPKLAADMAYGTFCNELEAVRLPTQVLHA